MTFPCGGGAGSAREGEPASPPGRGAAGADRETLAFYDANAAGYAAKSHLDAYRAHLDRFAAGLPPGGAVLDLGCGDGWAAGALAAMGFDVLGLDASAGLLAIAAMRPGVRTRHAVFEDVRESVAYDGVWASFSLLHAPHDAFPGHLARIARALRHGGRLYVGLKEGRGERRDALGRRYAYFEAGEVARHLAEAGFERPEIVREPGTGLANDCTHFLHCHTRRAP
ncbi:MAG: class I SAM-dependent methyltransferase [Paracoccaceae bacterium]